MMAATAASLHSPPNLLHHTNNNTPKPRCYNIIPTKNGHNLSYQPLISPLTLSKHSLRKPTILRASAAGGAATPENAVETAKEIVSATTGGDDGVSSIISILLFIAFVILSVLTIGVVYIGVTDFLQNREKDKFVKEEEAKKNKKGGKKKVGARSRAGPRGFGQKIEDDFDD